MLKYEWKIVEYNYIIKFYNTRFYIGENIMKNHTQRAVTVLPKYQQIAVELATRITSGEYQEGDKIYARSSLASQHGVSPETARRAICVLEDLNIVASVKGSGVIIKSYENAKRFVSQQQKRQSIDEIKNNLVECITRQKEDMIRLDDTLSELLLATEHFRSLNPFVPFQVKLTSKCKYLNQMVTDINFWQNTGATIVAIQRKESLLISPGPYIVLLEDDVVYFVTKDSSPDIVINYLNM